MYNFKNWRLLPITITVLSKIGGQWKTSSKLIQSSLEFPTFKKVKVSWNMMDVSQGRTLGGANRACPSTIGLLFSGSPQHILGLLGWKILPAPKAPVISWLFFHLESYVYLVKIAFASENLENVCLRWGTFSYIILILYPRSNTYSYSLYVIKNRPCMPP